jgi:hypothetical protein
MTHVRGNPAGGVAATLFPPPGAGMPTPAYYGSFDHVKSEKPGSVEVTLSSRIGSDLVDIGEIE